jgi:hypothetical protein
MIDILKKAFEMAEAETTDGSRLRGKVTIKLLYVVFDWVGYFYGTTDKRDSLGAPVPCSLDEAVKRDMIARVPAIMQKRCFELSVARVKHNTAAAAGQPVAPQSASRPTVN